MSFGVSAQQRARAQQLEKEAADKAAAEAAAESYKQAAANISAELDEIDLTTGNTADKADQIKVVAEYKYPDISETDFIKLLAADAAVNGTSPAVEVYIANTLAGTAVTNRGTSLDTAKSIIAGAKAGDRYAEEVAVAKALKEEKAKENNAAVTVRADDQTEGLIGESFIDLTSQTHQCILTHYLEPVAAFHRTQLHRTSIASNDGRPLGATNPFLANTTAPDNALPGADAKIILVDDSSADSSVAPVNAITSLGKTNVDDITPAQLAGVVPLLRLYKIYRKEGKETGKVEFKFSNKTDSGFLKGTSEQKFGEFVMDAGYAKGRSAGIKSFDWSFVGGDPFTATRDLTATLKIFFQDFRDLTEVRKDSKNLFDPDGKNLEYKYLDLVLQPDCRDSKKEEEENIQSRPKGKGQDYDIFNPDCYEIVIEVGYAPTPDLPTGLRNQTDTLYLTMTEHSFDIGQDGTFELTIDYRARLASLLGDKGMNVLEPGGGDLVSNSYAGTALTFDLKEVQKRIEAERKNSKDDEDYESEDLEALNSVKSHLLHLRNNSLYRNISNTLLMNGLIYKLPVPDDVFARFTNFDRYDRDKNALVALDVRSTWDIEEGDIKIAGDDSDASTIKWTRTGARKDPTDATASAEALEENTEKSLLKNYTGKEVRKSLKENIYFTTVGNIIAVALDHVTGEGSFLNLNPRGSIEELISFFKKSAGGEEESLSPTEKAAAAEVATAETAQEAGGVDVSDATAPSNKRSSTPDLKINPVRVQALERFRIILGAVTYIDAASGQEKTVNLAHLPVSMQKFREFMIDRVISQNRSFYSFQDFIKDILTDIIFDNLNRICFGGYTADDSSIRPGISLISGQGAKGATDADWIEPITSNTEKGIYEDRKEKTGNQSTYKTLNLALATQSSPIFSNTKINKAKEFNYLMFSAFSVGVLNSRLHGNKDKDADNGIAHFRYGNTKGLMKSVSFSKTPLEFAAEERYVREGTDNLLNQLAGRYEMQMSLVGNNMFIPGQYVYFDPVALGIGKTFANGETNRSLANLMGLGGYHIVIEVGNSISPGKFETSIKALWETGGTKEK